MLLLLVPLKIYQLSHHHMRRNKPNTYQVCVVNAELVFELANVVDHFSFVVHDSYHQWSITTLEQGI